MVTPTPHPSTDFWITCPRSISRGVRPIRSPQPFNAPTPTPPLTWPGAPSAALWQLCASPSRPPGPLPPPTHPDLRVYALILAAPRENVHLIRVLAHVERRLQQPQQLAFIVRQAQRDVARALRDAAVRGGGDAAAAGQPAGGAQRPAAGLAVLILLLLVLGLLIGMQGPCYQPVHFNEETEGYRPACPDTRAAVGIAKRGSDAALRSQPYASLPDTPGLGSCSCRAPAAARPPPPPAPPRPPTEPPAPASSPRPRWGQPSPPEEGHAARGTSAARPQPDPPPLQELHVTSCSNCTLCGMPHPGTPGTGPTTNRHPLGASALLTDVCRPNTHPNRPSVRRQGPALLQASPPHPSRSVNP